MLSVGTLLALEKNGTLANDGGGVLGKTQGYRCGDERAKPSRMGSRCRSPRATSGASRPRSEPETARLSELLSSACVRRGKRRRCRLYTSYSSRTRRNCNALDHNTTEITKLVRHLRDVQSDARIVISQGHCRDRQCAANDHRYLYQGEHDILRGQKIDQPRLPQSAAAPSSEACHEELKM